MVAYLPTFPQTLVESCYVINIVLTRHVIQTHWIVIDNFSRSYIVSVLSFNIAHAQCGIISLRLCMDELLCCSYCDFRCSSHHLLLKHIKVHENLPDFLMYCSICGKSARHL